MRSFDEDPIYVLASGARRHIPDPPTFEYLAFRRRDVEVLPQADVEGLPLGPPLPSYADRYQRYTQRFSMGVLTAGGVRSPGSTSTLRPPLLLTVAISFVIIASLAAWLAPPHLIPTGLEPAEQATAITAARTGVIQFTAAMVLLFGFYFTFETIRLSRLTQAAQEAKDNAARYSEAVGLTATTNPTDVRVGGLLALESLAMTSASQRTQVAKFLGAVLPVASAQEDSKRAIIEVRTALDAINAITESGELRLTVRGLALSGLEDVSLALNGCSLPESRLEGCSLTASKLAATKLYEASWSRVDFRYSDMAGAVVWGSEIVDCDLSWCVLTDAFFLASDLRGTSFVGSQLNGTIFSGADLRGANLRSTDLSRCDLTGTDLRGCLTDKNTRWPRHLNATS